MTETEQRREMSLIDRVRQMAGTVPSAPEEHREESDLVLPDGYRRRSPVQRYRMEGASARRRKIALCAVAAAAALALAVIAVLIFIR